MDDWIQIVLFRADRIRPLEEVAVRNFGTFSVPALYEVCKSKSVVEMKTDDLVPSLSSMLWEDEHGSAIKPSDVLANPISQPIQQQRIDKADLAFPIILFDTTQTEEHKKLSRTDGFDIKTVGRYDVLDGMHRLAKAVRTKQPTIRAFLVTWTEMQATRRKEFVFE